MSEGSVPDARGVIAGPDSPVAIEGTRGVRPSASASTSSKEVGVQIERLTIDDLADYGHRPGWHAYLMQLAEVASIRASCPRLSVGAVIADGQHRIISTGYNGAPAGKPSCMDEGCDMQHSKSTARDHCKRARHAEINALATAAARAVSVKGATAYVTHRPCADCQQAMGDAGVVSVWYLEEYGR